MHRRLFAPRWLTNLLQIGGIAAQPCAFVLWRMHGDDYLDTPAVIAWAGLTGLLLGHNWEASQLGLLMRLSSIAGYLAFASIPLAVLTRDWGWLAMLPISTIVGLGLLSLANDVDVPNGNSVPLN